MRILLAEDDDRVAEPLMEALRDRHYLVDWAMTGPEAWDQAEMTIYDAIILDVMLPGLDGISLCRRLRDRRATVPILLLTGRDTSLDKVIGLDAGADDYVVKPFDLAELLARIRALLRRGQALPEAILTWGQLALNPQTCEVRYDGAPIVVSAKEYELLELFLRSPNRTFDRAMLLDQLWSFEVAPTEEAIKAHIRRLRQKLAEAGAPKTLIETRYGLGYRLNPLFNDADR